MMMKRSVSEKLMIQIPKKKKDSGDEEDVNNNNNEKTTVDNKSKSLERKKSKKKKNKNNKILICINVLGSAGPLRMVVNDDDLVSSVIDSALKTYLRERRLPVLSSDVSHFLLFCANAGSEALSPSDAIGSQGGRNFVLCKKQKHPQMTEARSELISKKQASGFKAWLHKSLSFNKILSH